MSLSHPERTCIGCRKRFNKNELLRFTGEDALFDLKQKQPGRGYYLCSDSKCFERLANNKKAGKKFSLQPEKIISEIKLSLEKETKRTLNFYIRTGFVKRKPEKGDILIIRHVITEEKREALYSEASGLNLRCFETTGNMVTEGMLEESLVLSSSSPSIEKFLSGLVKLKRLSS